MRRVPGEKVVFAKEHWLLLADAVAKPADYSDTNLSKLRTSVDMALSAVSDAIVGESFQNWMILRQQLNQTVDAKKLQDDDDIQLVNVVLELLRFRDLIWKKDYTGRAYDVRTFCEKYLGPLVNRTGYPA